MQQINLYLPEFRPNREPLRAIHMLWGCAAFLLLLILFTIYSSVQNKKLQEKLVQEQQSLQAMQTQFLAISSKKVPQAGPELDAKIGRLQNDLQRHIQILAMIQHQDLGNDKGFSAQLNALAKASMNTISLDSFSLQRGGSYAELRGKTRTADQVPLYLQRLRANPGFENVGFGVLKVERDEKAGGVLVFSLEKAGKKKNEEGNQQ